MQLVLHSGVHYTEQERLIKSMLRNKSVFSEQGVYVPGPGSYRRLMRDTLNAIHRTPPADNAREVLLDAMLDESHADRLVLSDANFFRTPGTAMQSGVLYPAAAIRLKYLTDLFAKDEVEVFMAVRNPASLLPILFANAMDPTPEGFWGGRSPTDVRWSDTVQRIRNTLPHVPITIWCAEDLPQVWERVMRNMADIGPEHNIQGAFDLLETLLSKEGLEKFHAYLAKRPELSLTQREQVIAVFLERFAMEDKIEEALNMPGWNAALVDEMTEIYDDDLSVIERIPGIRLIEP